MNQARGWPQTSLPSYRELENPTPEPQKTPPAEQNASLPRVKSYHRFPEYCPPGFQVYKVAAGDTALSIARRFKTKLRTLIQANPHVEDINRVRPGMVLCVPDPEKLQALRWPPWPL